MFWILCLFGSLGVIRCQDLPVIVTTWDTTQSATIEAWDWLYGRQEDILDSIVAGCGVCELNSTCGSGVGAGFKPSETGEVTLDAMIMDGRTMDAAAVGCLRSIKNAIGVAYAVMKYTTHTLLVGELATEFAVEMGFPLEDLSTNSSWEDWAEWRDNSCQPNFWNNVSPDPDTSCGPYTPNPVVTSRDNSQPISAKGAEPDHDTIGMIAVDAEGNPASGTSTNGLSHKIAGRVGDSPIPGAGSYAEMGVGAAAATGNGDIMFRMLPTHYAVQLMGQGFSPVEAARDAVTRIAQYYPTYQGAVIAVNVNGTIGAACSGYTTFPYHYINPTTMTIVSDVIICEPAPANQN